MPQKDYTRVHRLLKILTLIQGDRTWTAARPGPGVRDERAEHRGGLLTTEALDAVTEAAMVLRPLRLPGRRK